MRHFIASRMSSGDSTSRACWRPRSSQRILSSSGSWRETPRQRRQAARSARRTKVRRAARSLARAPRDRQLRGRADLPEPARRGLVAAALGPAQLQRRRNLAGADRTRQAQVAARSARTPGASSGQGRRPRACCSPTASMSRAKSIGCDRAEDRAEELHAPVSPRLMRLVEDRDLDARQQLGDAAVAQRQVGEEQVVVDDHGGLARHRPRAAALLTWQPSRNCGHSLPRQFSRDRSTSGMARCCGSSRPSSSARSPLAVVCAQASIRGQRPHREAGRAAARPGARGRADACTVARPSLQQGDRHRHAEGIAQARQSRAGTAGPAASWWRCWRGSSGAGAPEHQVSVGLADARAGLDDERLARRSIAAATARSPSLELLARARRGADRRRRRAAAAASAAMAGALQGSWLHRRARVVERRGIAAPRHAGLWRFGSASMPGHLGRAASRRRFFRRRRDRSSSPASASRGR